eukprot:GEMP01107516.1.p1 GENE.GEMP01107516.1~~GEMP01107516.1.p1  ORF type:complete len:130 (-),score=10.57 GEMP01107516.1:47-436(-)
MNSPELSPPLIICALNIFVRRVLGGDVNHRAENARRCGPDSRRRNLSDFFSVKNTECFLQRLYFLLSSSHAVIVAHACTDASWFQRVIYLVQNRQFKHNAAAVGRVSPITPTKATNVGLWTIGVMLRKK